MILIDRKAQHGMTMLANMLNNKGIDSIYKDKKKNTQAHFVREHLRLTKWIPTYLPCNVAQLAIIRFTKERSVFTHFTPSIRCRECKTN